MPRKEVCVGWGCTKVFDADGVSVNGTIKVRCCDSNDIGFELIDDVEPETLGKEFEVDVEIPHIGPKIAFPDKFVQEEYFRKNRVGELKSSSLAGPVVGSSNTTTINATGTDNSGLPQEPASGDISVQISFFTLISHVQYIYYSNNSQKR